jgi:hypothetical protein
MSVRSRLRPALPTPAPAELEGRAVQALAGKRGRASFAPPPKAGKAVAALLRPLMPQGGVGLNELKRRWAEIAGAPYAGKAFPEKLAAGTLTLRAPSALAPFLQQQIPLLIERLKLAGVQARAIRIEQRAAVPAKSNLRPVKPRLGDADDAALVQSLDRIGEGPLKSALLRLGRAVKQG